MEEELVKKIENGPLVLLLGQKYLSINTNKDIFLEKCKNKFQKSDVITSRNYDTFLKLNLANDYEASSTWIENLCKDISVPLWLERIARVPWSSVYTSSIDTVIQRAFVSEWRKVQPIYDENFRVIDPRNKFNLHLTYLYGCISQIELSKRPPLSIQEKVKRKFTNNQFLQRLPELITLKGALIIEAYENDDWLSIEDLYSTVSRMGTVQTFLFSSSVSLLQNDLIQDLISSKKLVAYNESFAQFLSDLEGRGKLKLLAPDPENYYGKWIAIGNQKIKLPQELINKVSKTATIIDESLFYKKNFHNDDEKYSEFKNFLSSSLSSNWEGYANGFAFKRDYFDILKKNVLDKNNSQKNKDVPIILYGQSSSGKTISLGHLAYELSQLNKLPVLFIEKRYQKIDEIDIDRFCQWAEENNAKNTVVIWDGMIDADLYYNFLRKLNTRGRNIILIGSTYDNGKPRLSEDNFIESPIELTSSEKKRFLDYLKGIDILLSNLLSNVGDKNLLAMLYRYLPVTRKSIRTGLKSELDFFSRILRETKEETFIAQTGSMFAAMVSAGLVENSYTPIFESTQVIDGDEINISDLLIFSIMVPGQFALSVPYELLLRTVGFNSLSSSLFKALSNVDLITWSEDSQGNILLGPRTAIEAKILSQYLGSKKAHIEYIKILLREVKSQDFSSFGYESNPEIQFAVELLNSISPNNASSSYLEYLYDITNVLKELRISNQAYHPRLILKEASFLRELVKEKKLILEESRHSLLERAEIIVREALDQLKSFRERTITTFLRGELATILGSQAWEYVSDKGHSEDAKECYDLVKEINNYAFSSNPDNYNTLDVLAWTTDKLIRSNTFNVIEKINAEADMIHLFEMAEIEGVSDQNTEQFYNRKLQFYELLGKQEIADSVFEKLSISGFTSGYYIRAKKILGYSDTNRNSTTDELISKSIEVANYLNGVYDIIKDDGKCLFLLLKTWWISKTKSQLFNGEKQALPFSRSDWEFCNNLVDRLLFIGDIYQSATTLYLKAISEFHLGFIRNSIETFRTLDLESDFSSYGRRRIIKSYLASTSNGKPKIFSGEVKRSVSYLKNDKSGEIYVSELKEYVPFILSEFGKNEFQAGEIIDRFQIGFNFRGFIAVAIKY